MPLKNVNIFLSGKKFSLIYKASHEDIYYDFFWKNWDNKILLFFFFFWLTRISITNTNYIYMFLVKKTFYFIIFNIFVDSHHNGKMVSTSDYLCPNKWMHFDLLWTDYLRPINTCLMLPVGKYFDLLRNFLFWSLNQSTLQQLLLIPLSYPPDDTSTTHRYTSHRPLIHLVIK